MKNARKPKPVEGWAIYSDHGMVLIDARLPVFWLKSVALRGLCVGCRVVRVRVVPKGVRRARR